MVKTHEALTLALDALEQYYLEDAISLQGKAITAIREVLAQPEQEQFAFKHRIAELEGAVIGLQARLAQPEQSYPDNFIDALKFDVAKRDSEAQQAYEDAFVNGTGVMLGDKRIDPASIYKEPEQEPVASDAYDKIDRFLRNNLHDDDYAEYSSALDSLYTAPPQREWQGLTDEDLRKLADKHLFYQPEGYEVSGVFALARAIEAAHNIK